MIKAVLFDLDGTLLPMDQDLFLKKYFETLAAKLAGYGYEPRRLIGAIMAGTEHMLKNDGVRMNEDVFWEEFSRSYGKDCRVDEPIFEDYYKREFLTVRDYLGYTDESAALIRELKAKGVKLILATNPVFPAIATHTRMGWVGLKPSDFELITTYENVGFAKPNPDYYRDIATRVGLLPEECVMVGNDTVDDMIAGTVGMKVFLLTDNLITHGKADISEYPQGGFSELRSFLSGILR